MWHPPGKSDMTAEGTEPKGSVIVLMLHCSTWEKSSSTIVAGSLQTRLDVTGLLTLSSHLQVSSAATTVRTIL